MEYTYLWNVAFVTKISQVLLFLKILFSQKDRNSHVAFNSLEHFETLYNSRYILVLLKSLNSKIFNRPLMVVTMKIAERRLKQSGLNLNVWSQHLLKFVNNSTIAVKGQRRNTGIRNSMVSRLLAKKNRRWGEALAFARLQRKNVAISSNWKVAAALKNHEYSLSRPEAGRFPFVASFLVSSDIEYGRNWKQYAEGTHRVFSIAVPRILHSRAEG